MKWLIVLIAIESLLYCKGQLCEALIQEAKNEGKLRDSISQNFDKIMSEKVSCIESLALTGNYKALETYTSMLNDNGIIFREVLFESIEKIKAKLEVFIEKNDESETTQVEAKKITPVFRWAQSMEKVFVQVKFSYKFDYPSCENIEAFTTSIEESSIMISGKCDLSDIPIIFNLELPLLQAIDKRASVFKDEQQNFYFELKKNEKQYWPDLIPNERKKEYPQMSIWYEMRSKYESELKEYEKTEEDEEKSYEEIEKELKEQMRRERKQKKKRKSKSNKKKKSSSQSDL